MALDLITRFSNLEMKYELHSSGIFNIENSLTIPFSYNTFQLHSLTKKKIQEKKLITFHSFSDAQYNSSLFSLLQ